MANIIQDTNSERLNNTAQVTSNQQSSAINLLTVFKIPVIATWKVLAVCRFQVLVIIQCEVHFTIYTGILHMQTKYSICSE